MPTRKSHATAFGSAVTPYWYFGIETYTVPKLHPYEDPTIIAEPI